MISADKSSALIGATSQAVRAPPPPTKPKQVVEPPPPAERSGGGTVSSGGGDGSGRESVARQSGSSGAPLDLARSARTYAALIEMTGDADVAAMFSGFGRSMRAGVDVYA